MPTQKRNTTPLPAAQPKGFGPHTAAFLAGCEQAYQRTKNPVYVWDAMAWALSRGIPLPDWVVPYLREVAVGISRLSRDKVPGKRAIAPTIGRLLFPRRGRTNPFNAIKNDAHEIMIAFEVYNCQTNNWRKHHAKLEGPADWNSVFREVASSHLNSCDSCRRAPSAKTIERYWRKYAMWTIPPHLIKRAESRIKWLTAKQARAARRQWIDYILWQPPAASA